MNCRVFDTKQEMGSIAAAEGAAKIRNAIAARGEATIIVATGASQFEMLDALVQTPDIDWYKVSGFHLDEYIGLPISHRASFRSYLWQRFVRRLPTPLRAFHYLDGEGDVQQTIREKSALIAHERVDVAFIGIGENGHLAFNDPPADFETEQPYLVVTLDEACRRQQVSEGWFATIEQVPTQAISMSVKQIMKAAAIICTVPDERKAAALAQVVQGPVTAQVPASMLQKHRDATIYMDHAAASRLKSNNSSLTI